MSIAYLDTHPEFDQLFSEAMSSVEHLTGNEFLQDFNWGEFKRLIDVGRLDWAQNFKYFASPSAINSTRL